MIRFYMRKGRWRVTSDHTVVNARDWWNAINQVKCMNHKLRLARHNPIRDNRVTHPKEPS